MFKYGDYSHQLTVPADGWAPTGNVIQTSVANKLVIGSGRAEINEHLESLTQAASDRTLNGDITHPIIVTYTWERIG